MPRTITSLRGVPRPDDSDWIDLEAAAPALVAIHPDELVRAASSGVLPTRIEKGRRLVVFSDLKAWAAKRSGPSWLQS